VDESSCQGLDWDPISGASANSAFAAVLAGFVFACIVVVGTDRGHSDPRSRANTLVLFMSAFFCLVASSYLGALTSSEVVCLRAWTITVYSSSLLAIGGTAVFTGLAWLLNGYIEATDPNSSSRQVARFAELCAYGVAFVVVPLITITAQGYMFDMETATEIPSWLRASTWIYLTVMLLLIVSGTTKRLGRRFRSRLPLIRVGAAILATTVISLIAMSVTNSLHAPGWASVPSSILVTTTLFPLVASAVLLLLLLATLPHPPRGSADQEDSAPSE